MPQLHETHMGQKLITKDIPELIKAINRLAAALEAAAPKRKEAVSIWKGETK